VGGGGWEWGLGGGGWRGAEESEVEEEARPVPDTEEENEGGGTQWGRRAFGWAGGLGMCSGRASAHRLSCLSYYLLLLLLR
jgi:hypothetical protein